LAKRCNLLGLFPRGTLYGSYSPRYLNVCPFLFVFFRFLSEDDCPGEVGELGELGMLKELGLGEVGEGG